MGGSPVICTLEKAILQVPEVSATYDAIFES